MNTSKRVFGSFFALVAVLGTCALTGCAAESTEDTGDSQDAIKQNAATGDVVMVGWAATSLGVANVRDKSSTSGKLLGTVDEGVTLRVASPESNGYVGVYYDQGTRTACTPSMNKPKCTLGFITKEALLDPKKPEGYCLAPATGDRQVNRAGTLVMEDRFLSETALKSTESLTLTNGCAKQTRTAKQILGRELAAGEQLVASMTFVRDGAIYGGACAFAFAGSGAKSITVEPGYPPGGGSCLQQGATSAHIKYYVTK